MTRNPHPEGDLQPSEQGREALDRVPEEVLTEAKAALRQQQEGELAVLVFDSLLDEQDPPEDHRLRFEHPDLRIDLRVSVKGAEARISGDIVPPGTDARVELLFEGGDLGFVSEGCGGSFSFSPIRHGLTRLSIRRPDSDVVVRTDWFRI
jgi:hypothetical protein